MTTGFGSGILWPSPMNMHKMRKDTSECEMEEKNADIDNDDGNGNDGGDNGGGGD